MIDALHIVAERKITEAIRNGELACEGWKGRPLVFEDDSCVPPDLRMAYKILKNADFLPPELEIKKEIAQLEDLISRTEDEHGKLRQLKKLNMLVFKLNNMRQRSIQFEEQERYFPKIVEKISIAKGLKK